MSMSCQANDRQLFWALLNASMNLSIETESFRPLNPPILGDFKILVPLKLGGLGQFIFAFSNALF